MIDPSIITRGAEMGQLQQRQNMESLGEFGGNLGQLVLGLALTRCDNLRPQKNNKPLQTNLYFHLS